eukprot:1276847-Pyramimonas_sp.AAC.1
MVRVYYGTHPDDLKPTFTHHPKVGVPKGAEGFQTMARWKKQKRSQFTRDETSSHATKNMSVLPWVHGLEALGGSLGHTNLGG